MSWEQYTKENTDQDLIKMGITPSHIRQWNVLHSLLDRNESLYYDYLRSNYASIIHIVTNPTVSWIAKNFSNLFRRPRGMYFSAKDDGNMAAMVYNWPNDDVKLILITDGENIVGDAGIGGMAVVQSKADVYIAGSAFKP